ncbi:MAG: hydroxypyruvate isomerase [Pseudomonadota bacterium]|jgi:hydroxypyruvate isomerase
MPRFSANLSLLYAELPFLERFRAAKADGFEAVECQFPYESSTGVKLHQVVQVLQELDMPMDLHNMPAGDWSQGDRGIACDPARVEEFKIGLLDAIQYAKILHVPHINCLSGKLPEGVSRESAQSTFVSNLTFAAEVLKKENIKLLIEPINTFDMPGFFLSSSQHAVETIMAVKSNNLYLQYDAYHMHRMGEDILDMEELLPFIDHIQVADHPGRHEPGTGDIPYQEFFRLIDDLAYDGWVGCEYHSLNRANFFGI